MSKFFMENLITQILREINFAGSRSTKNAVFAILEAVKFVHLENFSHLKCKKS